MKIINGIFVLILLTIDTALAQDYFPLHQGNNWTYSIYQDSVATDTYYRELLEPEFLDTLGISVKIYPYQNEYNNNGFPGPFRYYYLKDDLNETVYYTTQYSNIPDIQIEEFRHQYSQGDTLESQFHQYVCSYFGDFETLEGLFFTECWKLTESSSGAYYLFAPNVGMVFYTSESNVTGWTQTEITDYYINELYLGNRNFNPKDDISIYPNPTAETINIKNNSEKRLLNLTLYDLNGLVQFRVKMSNEIALNIRHLPPGNYYLVASENNVVLWNSTITKM